jgi:hypothetical protein
MGFAVVQGVTGDVLVVFAEAGDFACVFHFLPGIGRYYSVMLGNLNPKSEIEMANLPQSVGHK